MNVVTFNILSPEYTNPSWFANTSAEHLDKNYRLNLIKELLTKWINDEFIICLQEISSEWSIILNEFFTARNYLIFLDQSNGKCMTGTFIPRNKYDIIEVGFYDLTDNAIKLFGSDNKNIDKNINRKLILCHIVDKQTNNKVWIGNIHMPCYFRNPTLMMIYTSSLINLIETYTSLHSSIFDQNIILMGDFNSNYNGDEYKNITENILPGYYLEKDERIITFEDVKKLYSHQEDTTCIACQKGENVNFILDYIFTYGMKSIECYVDRTSDVALPSKGHPSDHFPVIAKFTF